MRRTHERARKYTTHKQCGSTSTSDWFKVLFHFLILCKWQLPLEIWGFVLFANLCDLSKLIIIIKNSRRTEDNKSKWIIMTQKKRKYWCIALVMLSNSESYLNPVRRVVLVFQKMLYSAQLLKTCCHDFQLYLSICITGVAITYLRQTAAALLDSVLHCTV